MGIEIELLKMIGAFIFFMLIIAVIAGICTAVSNKALRMFRPEIYYERDSLKKQLNVKIRELNKSSLEITELKNKMNTFTFTQPKTDHNVYIKSKNDYQV